MKSLKHYIAMVSLAALYSASAGAADTLTAWRTSGLGDFGGNSKFYTTEQMMIGHANSAAICVTSTSCDIAVSLTSKTNTDNKTATLSGNIYVIEPDPIFPPAYNLLPSKKTGVDHAVSGTLDLTTRTVSVSIGPGNSGIKFTGSLGLSAITIYDASGVGVSGNVLRIDLSSQ